MIGVVIEGHAAKVQVGHEVVEDLDSGFVVHIDIRVTSDEHKIFRVRIQHFLQESSELCNLCNKLSLLTRSW